MICSRILTAETSFVFVPVTDASANAEPYSSLFSYLFGRGGSDVSRRSDPRYLRTEKSQSTLGSEFLGRKKRAYDAAAAADTDNMDRLVAKRVPGSGKLFSVVVSFTYKGRH